MPDATGGCAPASLSPCAPRFGDVSCVKAVTEVPPGDTDIFSEGTFNEHIYKVRSRIFVRTRMFVNNPTVTSVPFYLRKALQVVCACCCRDLLWCQFYDGTVVPEQDE